MAPEPQGADEAVEATVVEDPPSQALELASREQPALAVTPQVKAEELVERLEVIREAMNDAMRVGVDYGEVPGTNKPTLLKPGAEKLSVLFQLDVQLENEKVWDHPHLTVISHATVYHAPTRARLGYGEGICSTREKKYAYRNAQRTCPNCGTAAIYESRKDDEPGFYCWRKKDGCGAKFAPDDRRIVGQQAGQIENPDLADYWNTVVKMAEKRARIDAVLAVTGASALFTQDVEDSSANGRRPPQEPATDPQRPHGPEIDPGLRTRASNAARKLCGGSQEGAQALWSRIREACGGEYMPFAAGTALVEAAEVLDKVPWEPEYRDPRGDIPSTGETRTRAPSDAEIAGLEDQVLNTWIQAGDSEQAALRKVKDCGGRWNKLQLSLEAAARKIRQKERTP